MLQFMLPDELVEMTDVVLRNGHAHGSCSRDGSTAHVVITFQNYTGVKDICVV